MNRIAVVGAGIVGRLMAWRAVREGHRVTLFDRAGWKNPAACSHAAAGLLAPLAEGVGARDAAIYRLGLVSRDLWRRLSVEGSREIKTSTAGSLALARGGDRREVDELEDRIARLLPEARIERIGADRLARLEPGLEGEDLSGLLLMDEGHVDSREALQVIGETLAEHPLLEPRLHAEVLQVEPYGVTTALCHEAFDLVMDCRGLGARGDLTGLRGVRGEIVEVRAPEVKLTRPVRILHQRFPIYVVPRGEDRYAIGATCFESESLAPVSVLSVLELLGAAYALHPGFRYAEVTDLIANARPAFEDHWPRIAAQPGLLRVNGFYRHGFLFSPLVAEVVMRLIVNGVERELGEPRSLAAVLDQLGFKGDAFAVAVNRDFVPRTNHAATPLRDGDEIEVVAPMAGG